MTGTGFQRHAAAELIAKADRLGAPVPDELRVIVGSCHSGSAGARAYADAHPIGARGDDDPTVPDVMIACCESVAYRGLASCTCWEPVFTVEQAEPRPLTSPDELAARPRMCGDCAFRKGSPERETEYEEEALFALADRGDPFWCHDGMRRPVQWRHPASGVTVDGDSADWQPPRVGAVPYRADGSPALLCAGWAARAVRARERQT